MIWRYRWVFAISCVISLLGLGYVCDIHPLILQMDQVAQQRNEISRLMRRGDAGVRAGAVAVNQYASVMQAFLLTMQESGLRIVEMHADDKSPLSVKMTLQGQYQQMVVLLELLEQNSAVVKNLSMRLEAEGFLRMTADFLLAQWRNVPLSDKNNLQQPFCMPDVMDQWFLSVNQK